MFNLVSNIFNTNNLATVNTSFYDKYMDRSRLFYTNTERPGPMLKKKYRGIKYHPQQDLACYNHW